MRPLGAQVETERLDPGVSDQGAQVTRSIQWAMSAAPVGHRAVLPPAGESVLGVVDGIGAEHRDDRDGAGHVRLVVRRPAAIDHRREAARHSRRCLRIDGFTDDGVSVSSRRTRPTCPPSAASTRRKARHTPGRLATASPTHRTCTPAPGPFSARRTRRAASIEGSSTTTTTAGSGARRVGDSVVAERPQPDGASPPDRVETRPSSWSRTTRTAAASPAR